MKLFFSSIDRDDYARNYNALWQNEVWIHFLGLIFIDYNLVLRNIQGYELYESVAQSTFESQLEVTIVLDLLIRIKCWVVEDNDSWGFDAVSILFVQDRQK